MQVLAIDLSPQALQILGERGVEQRQQADIFAFDGGRFDTLLLMMHGIGMVGDLEGLDRFLTHAHTLLKPGGSSCSIPLTSVAQTTLCTWPTRRPTGGRGAMLARSACGSSTGERWGRPLAGCTWTRARWPNARGGWAGPAA